MEDRNTVQIQEARENGIKLVLKEQEGVLP